MLIAVLVVILVVALIVCVLLFSTSATFKRIVDNCNGMKTTLPPCLLFVVLIVIPVGVLIVCVLVSVECSVVITFNATLDRR